MSDLALPVSTDLSAFLQRYGTAPAVEYKFYNGDVILWYEDKQHAYFRKTEDGRLVMIPGVTTVCDVIDKSGPLTQWAANEACNYLRGKWEAGKTYTTEEIEVMLNEARFNFRTISKVATDIGKIAHSWLEDYLKAIVRGLPFDQSILPDNEQARNCISAALNWLNIHQYRPLHTERKVYSREYDFAGTTDGIGLFTGCGDPECCGDYADVEDLLAIIDWKSSRNHYETYRFQAASYAVAHAEETGQTPTLRIILRLGKDDGQFDPRMYDYETQQDDFDTFLNALCIYRRIKALKDAEKEEKREVKDAARAAKTAVKEAEKAAKKDARDAERLAKKAAKEAERLAKKAAVKGTPKLSSIPMEVRP